MFQKAIVHLDLDAFFASVEQLKNRTLQGKPILIGGNSSRGVVASCVLSNFSSFCDVQIEHLYF